MSTSTDMGPSRVPWNKGRLTGQKPRDIRLEAFVVVLCGGIRRLLDHVERRDALDGQRRRQHERDPVVPGHREAHALLARFDVAAHVVRFQRVSDVSHRGVAFAARTQLGVLIQREAGRRLYAETQDCTITYRRVAKKLTVAVVHRDLEGLRAEVGFERTIAATG
jgi:hypothetical protein